MSVVQTGDVDRRTSQLVRASPPLPVPRSHQVDRYAWAAAALEGLVREAPSNVVADIGAGSGVMRDSVQRAGGLWLGFDLAPQRDDVMRWDLDEPAPHDTPRVGVALMLEVI